MGLIFADGFDSYAASSDMARNWFAAGWSWNSTAGRNGGGAMQTVTSAQTQTTPKIFSVANGSTAGVLGWIKISTSPASQVNFIATRNTGGSFTGGIAVTTGGLLRLVDNGGTTLQTGGTSVADNAWHWIEAVLCSDTTNNNKCYVDGVSQWNAAVVLANLGAWTYFDLLSSSTGTWTVDDIWWCDTTAAVDPRPANIPIGPKQINTLRPSADSSVQFTRSSGATNYSLVNETAADDDTSYVEDGTSTHVDLYDYADLSFTPSSITAVQLVSRIKNTGAGTINFKTRCSSSSTTSDSASTVAPASYQNFRQILNQDPNTSAAWTYANLNAAKFGITVV